MPKRICARESFMQNTVDDLSGRAYNDGMYEFPPTAWEVHGLMPGPLTVIYVPILVAVIVFVRRSTLVRRLFLFAFLGTFTCAFGFARFAMTRSTLDRLFPLGST